VDEDPDEADLIALAFKISGYPVDVVVSLSGSEAIANMIAPERVPFNLVLLNLDSGASSGAAVLRELADHSYGCWAPKVALTSIVEPSAIESWYRLGAASVLLKPSDFDGFVGMVSDLCAYWFRMNLLPMPA
jgi:DNA-binding NarL/FixJ family response regulator